VRAGWSGRGGDNDSEGEGRRVLAEHHQDWTGGHKPDTPASEYEPDVPSSEHCPTRQRASEYSLTGQQASEYKLETQVSESQACTAWRFGLVSCAYRRRPVTSPQRAQDLGAVPRSQ
jgi:hypothetical protein